MMNANVCLGYRYLTVARLVTGLSMPCLLSACSAVQSRIDSATSRSIGAEPISIDDINAMKSKMFTKQDTPTATQMTALAILDSEQKCTAFKRRLSAGERAFDTVGDVSAGVLSALGAVFTPAATVRAFSAAATIVTGIKTAVDADIYAKFTAPLIVQALNKTYDVDMLAEMKIVAQPDGVTDFPAALADLASIHDECSLDRATTYLTQQNDTTPANDEQKTAGQDHSRASRRTTGVKPLAAEAPTPRKNKGNTVVVPTALPPNAR